ncbi:MAG: RpiB/LacA/LacB family sugar-phosphate isomerase [Planctomycetota bacterium]|jgi:ribose 5-phosphate isomerase B
MKIVVGSDHRGFKAKSLIKELLAQLGHECIDIGTTSSEPVDYPDPAYQAAMEVAQQKADRAILACGTGIGMSITANKVKGIRAALCHDELSAQISRHHNDANVLCISGDLIGEVRHHNDANVLCISGDLIGEVLLRRIVEVWLSTEFSGGRHKRRNLKILAIEQGKDPSEITNSGQ